MNKEENYRNLAGNITAFTDNTRFYEDWLVIQQYVDDWLDEIDKLQQENQSLKEEIYNIRMKNKRLKVKIKKIIDAINYLDTDEKIVSTIKVILNRELKEQNIKK